MSQIVEVTNVVALELEAYALVAKFQKPTLNLGEVIVCFVLIWMRTRQTSILTT